MVTSAAETAAAKGTCRSQCSCGKANVDWRGRDGVAEELVAVEVLAENVSSGEEEFLHGAAR